MSGLHVAVVGSGDATDEDVATAEEVGRLLAEAGAVVVTGGLDGVMAGACRGACERGGTTVGVLPGPDRENGNPHLTVSIPTGLGEMRNALVVGAADIVIAISGGYGTLSEIALALRAGKRVIGVNTWELRLHGHEHPGVEQATDARDAVRRALDGQ